MTYSRLSQLQIITLVPAFQPPQGINKEGWLCSSWLMCCSGNISSTLERDILSHKRLTHVATLAVTVATVTWWNETRSKLCSFDLKQKEAAERKDMYSIISDKAVCFLLYFYSATDKLRRTHRWCFLTAASLCIFGCLFSVWGGHFNLY